MSDPISTLLQAAQQARTQGCRKEARRSYADAASHARREGDLKRLAHALRHMADIDREDGVASAGLEDALEAVQLYRQDPEVEPLDLANALRPAALALVVLGRKVEAQPLWQEACYLYGVAGVEAGVAECRAHID